MSHELQVVFAGLSVAGSIIGSTAVMLVKFGSVSQQLTTVHKQLAEHIDNNRAQHAQLFEGHTACERERGELVAKVDSLRGRVDQLVSPGG